MLEILEITIRAIMLILSIKKTIDKYDKIVSPFLLHMIGKFIEYFK